MYLLRCRLARPAKCLDIGSSTDQTQASDEAATHGLCHACCRARWRLLGAVGEVLYPKVAAQVRPFAHACRADTETVLVVVAMVEPQSVHIDVAPNHTAVEAGPAVELGRRVAVRRSADDWRGVVARAVASAGVSGRRGLRWRRKWSGLGPELAKDLAGLARWSGLPMAIW